jgi:hypothetical protein
MDTSRKQKQNTIHKLYCIIILVYCTQWCSSINVQGIRDIEWSKQIELWDIYDEGQP